MYFQLYSPELHEQKDGKEYVVEFDFLGKDSIRWNYYIFH